MRANSLVWRQLNAWLTSVEGTGLGPENCKPLWDKVVAQGSGHQKSWRGALF